jgi:uncharacterized protein (DUF4415 family)
MNTKGNVKRKFKRNGAAEEARIKAGIADDPDTRELMAKDFAEMLPFREMMKRRGRPKAATHKVPITLRLEPRIVEYFRRSGRGWQTRMNDTLARYVARQSPGRA